MNMKKYVLIVVLALLSLMVTGCGENEIEKENKEIIESLHNDELYMRFIDAFPKVQPITCKKGDVTDDGIEDMIMIYKYDQSVKMRVLINGEEIIFTDEISAPLQNQTIAFRDIDHKNEVEFIVSGSKRGNVGYAIYRIIDNEIKDLFGEGMNECC